MRGAALSTRVALKGSIVRGDFLPFLFHLLMTIAALVAAMAAHLVLRMPAIRMDATAAERRPVSAVVTELDSVPVFAIAINGDKLYSTDESGCMIYTHLSDASRVLAQLQSTYPAEALALEALSLGTVLSESGLLIKREAPPRITLVASPDAKRAARDLRAKGPAASSSDPPIVSSAVPKRWRPLTEIPVFHIGTLARRSSKAVEVDEAAEGLLWPLFFRLSDIDRLWEELGDSSTERPPVRAAPSDIATRRLPARARGAHASAHHGAPFPTGARHRPRDARRLPARARRCAGPSARVCASRRARLCGREESAGAGGRGLAASWWRRGTGVKATL